MSKRQSWPKQQTELGRTAVSGSCERGLRPSGSRIPWVEDSALFYALSHHREELIGKAWWDWPEPVR